MMDFIFHKRQPERQRKAAEFVLDLDLYYEYDPIWTPNSFTKIAEPFEVVTMALKFMGNGPISTRKITYDPKNKVTKMFYEVKWRSWGTFASAMIGLVVIAVWILFLINIGFETPFLITG